MWLACRTVALFICVVSPAMAQEITAGRADPKLFPIFGNAWYIFIDGEIKADASARLEQFILFNKVSTAQPSFSTHPEEASREGCPLDGQSENIICGPTLAWGRC